MAARRPRGTALQRTTGSLQRAVAPGWLGDGLSAATSIVAVIVWRAPGASVTACTLTLPVSTHTISGHSSSPKSGIARALSTHGFQTTVALERLLRTTIRRRAPGS